MLDDKLFKAHRFAVSMGAGDECVVNERHWLAMSAEQRAELRDVAAGVQSTISNTDPPADVDSVAPLG